MGARTQVSVCVFDGTGEELRERLFYIFFLNIYLVKIESSYDHEPLMDGAYWGRGLRDVGS